MNCQKTVCHSLNCAFWYRVNVSKAEQFSNQLVAPEIGNLCFGESNETSFDFNRRSGHFGSGDV